MIQADVKEDVIVNIHVQEGNIEAQITNLDKVNLNKKSDQKNKILHFVIKAHDFS
jgi:cytoskeletal protein CcmA (bactofilin family)